MRIGALFLCLILFAATSLLGQGSVHTDEVASLRGIAAVNVIIEELTQGAVKWGVSETQLAGDVELQLRKAGIRVVSESEMPLNMIGGGYLYLRVSVVPDRGDVHCFGVTVFFKQAVRMARDEKIGVIGTTWEAAGMGSNRVGLVRTVVADYVGRFVSDYLEANPHK